MNEAIKLDEFDVQETINSIIRKYGYNDFSECNIEALKSAVLHMSDEQKESIKMILNADELNKLKMLISELVRREKHE